MYDSIIFDLDGTLLDTSQGIFNSVRYTEKKMMLKPVFDEQLNKFVGPPPKDQYMTTYGLGENEAQLAVKYHRQYSKINGIYEARVYDNMFEVLEKLCISGIKLAVATLKNQSIANTILDYHGLLKFFSVVIGMDEEESLNKAEIIKIAIYKLNAKNVLMIGDTEYDYQGAKKLGIDFIGVSYGFGFKEDENNYGFTIVSSPYGIIKEIIK